MKSWKNLFLITILTITSFIVCGCKKDRIVQIQDKGTHYLMSIDYTKNKTHYETGKFIGKAILKDVDSYEKRVDEFIALTAKNYGYPEEVPGTPEEHYMLFMKRVGDLKPLLPQTIKDEIEGVADCFSGKNNDIMGDGKLSINEYYFLNLIIESSENTECCAVSAFNSASKTGSTIIARVMDWYIDTEKKEVENLFGITEFKYNDFTLYTIGIIGHLGIITGIKNNGIYSAILFSRNNTPYSSSGKYSLSMELRYAMEKFSSIDEIADYMRVKDRNYTMNHNIFLSDKKRSIVLENNIQGGPTSERKIRTCTSKLNKGVNWGFENRIACVNSFILYGNDDNHTTIPGNQNRWLSLVKLMAEKKVPLSSNDLRSIITFYPGEKPGDFDEGGLYTKWSKQVMIFQPDDMSLEIFFSPKKGDIPLKPVFEKIQLGNI